MYDNWRSGTVIILECNIEKALCGCKIAIMMQYLALWNIIWEDTEFSFTVQEIFVTDTDVKEVKMIHNSLWNSLMPDNFCFFVCLL